jgi:hypothetical protein
MVRAELQDLILRLAAGSKGTALDVGVAQPIVEAALTAPGRLPRSAILCTAILGEPRKASVLFRGTVNDSDRIDEAIWAWPLTEIERLDVPAPARGAQGFWRWNAS